MTIPPEPPHKLRLSRAQIRNVDRVAIDEYGILGLVLMENAGRSIADRICEIGIHGTVVIACGAGNNGGDGHVLARHLDTRGYDVLTVQVTSREKLAGDAKVNLEINERLHIRQIWAVDERDLENDSLKHALSSGDWLVDALLGTGATGPPRAHFASFIKQMNKSTAKKLAVDIPSGLDCDTGRTPGEVFRADYTTTLVAPKLAFTRSSNSVTGEVSVHDIGIPDRLVRLATGTT